MREEEIFLFTELTLKDEMQTRTFNFRGTVILMHIGVVFGSVNLLPNLGRLKLFIYFFDRERAVS